MRSKALAISSCDQPSTSYSQTTVRVTGESRASARSRSMRSEVRLSASAGAGPALFGPRLERDARAMPGRTERHEAAADRDAAHPDAERRFAAKIVQVLEHGDQRVLQQVLGHAPCCAHQAADDAERRRAPPARTARARAAASPARAAAELIGRNFDFRESLHFSYGSRCRPGVERSQTAGVLALYFPPRAGMAELVDAADSKSVALIRRVGSIPSPGTTQLR